MPNYSNGKIYKVVNDVINMVYIGSTTRGLSTRMTDHRSKYKQRLTTGKQYKQWGDINDCKIYLIEDFPCERKEELIKRERFYIESIKCTNLTLPCCTKEELKEQKKQYRSNNKEKIAEKKKQYQIINKEKIKQYYINNKEKIAEQEKQYRIDNKEKLAEKRRIKYNCECGSTILKVDKSKHNKTQKHLNYEGLVSASKTT